MIIGLAGRAGSGKDFVATHHLVPHGFRNLALADEIKIRAVVTGVATYEQAFYTKPPVVRKWLQEEGTERGRDVFGENCWCQGLAARIQLMKDRWLEQDFVITDVRFPNEVRFIQNELGGKVLKIQAPDRVAASPLTAEQRNHSSETSVDTLDGLVDGFLLNNPDEADYLAWQVARHLMRFGTNNYEANLSPLEKPSVGVRADLNKRMYR